MSERPAGLDRLLAHVADTLPDEDDQPAPCAQCHRPFDPTDKRFDGRGRHDETPFCRRCVDRCHESSDFAHECAICR
ncbi:hypothetical protein AB0K09_15675 [Streptomyces sp. NPDC049577]|uniref:hypothetical protein n=1 Tax=Streptomyces sp. NPDC049577 TaxID=3155153 RepID=UPI003421E1D0